MKLNDFKQTEKRLDELRLSSLVGDYGAAALKSIFTGQSTKQQMVMDIFARDFIDDATSALDSAIKSGLVNPNMKSKGPSKTPVNPQSIKPTAPSAPTATAPAGQAAASSAGQATKSTAPAVGKFNQQKQTTQNMNQYIQSAAKTINATQDKAQKIALTKELVNYMADRKGYPEWDNAVATVQQVIRKGNVDPNFANAALGKIKAGQTMAEAWTIFYINKLLEAVNVSWKEIGLTVLKESFTGHYFIAETKFLKLNNIFESILNEAQSIGDYLRNWYAGYMQGINYQANMQDVDKLIKSIEQSYMSDKGKNGFKQLAQMSYAISKGAVPAGAKDEEGKLKAAAAQASKDEPKAPGQSASPAATSATSATPNTQQGSQLNSHQIAAQIQQDLTKLSKIDAKVYNDLIKSLKPASEPAPQAAPAQGQFKDKPVSQPGASAGLVAESKKKINSRRLK